MVAPGCLSSIAGGHDRRGERPRHELALVVDEEHPVGVAVEGEARRRRRSRAPGPGGRRRFSGWIGSAGWLGKVPSSSPYMISSVERQALEHRRARPGRPCRWRCRPRSSAGFRTPTSTKRVHVVGEVGRATSRAGDRARAWPTAARPATASALISAEAGVLADGPGAGQAELDAVVLGGVVRGGEHARRGRRSGPAAKNSRSVEARPRSTTSRPWPVTPRANAAASSTPEGRMSRATSTVPRRRRSSAAKRGEGGADALDERRRRAGRGRCPGCRRP